MPMVTAQQQYNELKPRLLKAMSWLDDPKNKGHTDQWYPKYLELFNQATYLERMMRIENARVKV